MRPIRRLVQLCYFAGEYLIMSIISKRGPGFFFRGFFNLPRWLYLHGLGGLVSGHVLLLTAKGRKTGLTRLTALGYQRHGDDGAYYVTSGWDGKTDWYQNVRADPHVRVRVGKREFDTVAEPVAQAEAMVYLAESARENPFAARMWRRWTGRRYDGSEECLREAATHFPMIALRPPGSLT